MFQMACGIDPALSKLHRPGKQSALPLYQFWQESHMMGWAAAMKPASTHTLPVHHTYE